MTDDKAYENIEKFLEGNLGGEELQQFEHKLKTDPEFSARVEDYRLAVKSVETYGGQKLKARLKQIHQEEIKSSITFNHRELIRLAAIFIGLLIVSVPLLYNYLHKSPDYHALYEEHFNPYPDILSQRGTDQESQLLSEALSYYKNADYENAAELFEVLQNQDTGHQNLMKLYAGISYLGSNEPEKAETTFRKILAEDDSSFAGQARWYLALSLLGRDRVEDAKLVLEQIADEKSYNHVKARKLLDEL